MISDKELWDELRRGDKQALRRIYDQEVDYLVNYGMKVFGDLIKVQDAIHDLFVDLWQKREGLGETTSIRKYLAVSLRRRVIAYTKKTSRIQSTENMESHDFRLDLSVEELIVNSEISEEQLLRVKIALEQLSPRQKEAIYLKYYQGMEYEQISEIMGVSYQSLRNLISSGVKRMRKELGGKLLLLIFLT